MAQSLPFGRWLKRLRGERDLTQDALAEAVNCATHTIRAFESGARRPSRDMADRLADALQLPAEQREEFTRAARTTTNAIPGRSSAVEQPVVSQVEAPGDRRVEGHEATPRAPVAPPSPILATKLYMPRPRSELVSRQRLLARLDAGLDGLLTVVTAPAGFGKTTLIADWLHREPELEGPRASAFGAVAPGRRVAWLALDAGDSDPALFLRYLIAALQTIEPGVGAAALELLRSPQLPPLETLLPLLVNDLTLLPERSILVLDDYHVIDALSVHEALAFLVAHLPPQVHLVITSRVDPPLPLARLRARRQLSELRAADLRFTVDEAGAFFEQVMDVPIDAEAVATLDGRTEGWIAGLQLAALAMQQRPDHQAFVQAFAGSNRFVVDYLVEEVVERLPAHLHSFVLETSILERLSGPLCDAVLGIEHPSRQSASIQAAYSQRLLMELERSNVFLIPLDDERHWYRYHHLFGEVVRMRLQHGVAAEHVAELHRRASIWYEREGLESEAIRHAMAAGDWERAVRLLTENIPPVVARSQFYTAVGWLNAVPDALFAAHPALYVYHAAVLMYTNQVERAAARLQEADRAVAQGGVSHTADEERTLRGQIAVIKAAVFRIRGDLERCVSLSREALELLPSPETVPLKLRPVAMLNASRAFLVTGDVSPAVEERVAAVVAPVRASVNRFALLTSITNLARLRVLQGRLRHAAATYGEAAEAATGPGGLQAVVGGAAYYVGLGDLHREWNDLEAAEELLEQGLNLVQGSLTVDADVLTGGYIAMARLRQARGQQAAALQALQTFMELARERNVATHVIAQAMAAGAWLALRQGDLESAIQWADAAGLDAHDDVSYAREPEYLAFARVRIAQARSNPAAPRFQEAFLLLDRMLAAAEPAMRMHSVIEILILQALAFHAQGDRKHALASVDRALSLAAPEGYVRVFVDEGTPMATLLRERQRTTGISDYVARLLLLFPDGENQPLEQGAARRPAAHADLLTDRELEVLRLLAAGQSNQAIAGELVVAVGTIKRHLNNIFGKLGVQSRLHAVSRARDLGLL